MVVAGTALGLFGLARLFVGPDQPATTAATIASGTPTRSVSPSPASRTPNASPSGKAPVIGYTCAQPNSQVEADFDGDGRLDTAMVAPTGTKFVQHPLPCPTAPQGATPSPQGHMSITAAWADGARGTWPLPECTGACAALSAHDIDGNGTAELELLVDRKGSTNIVNFLALPPSEAGPILLAVAPPGDLTHPAGRPLTLASGGSTRGHGLVTCRSPSELISTEAERSVDGRTWVLRETVFAYDRTGSPIASSPQTMGTFTVVSTRTSTAPVDPDAALPPVAGSPCFVPAG